MLVTRGKVSNAILSQTRGSASKLMLDGVFAPYKDQAKRENLTQSHASPKQVETPRAASMSG